MIISEFCDAAITSSQDPRCSQMTGDKHNNNQSLVDQLIAVVLRLPWADVLADNVKALRKAIQGSSYRG